MGSCQTTIIDLHEENEADMEAVLDLLKKRINLQSFHSQATLVLFPSEENQFKALSALRNYGIENVKIKPLFFHDSERVSGSGDFVENIRCGLLVGWFTVAQPINIYHGSLSSISEIVERISPPGSELAFISGSPAPIACLGWESCLSTKYYGTTEEVKSVKDHLCGAGYSESLISVTWSQDTESIESKGQENRVAEGEEVGLNYHGSIMLKEQLGEARVDGINVREDNQNIQLSEEVMKSKSQETFSFSSEDELTNSLVPIVKLQEV